MRCVYYLLKEKVGESCGKGFMRHYYYKYCKEQFTSLVFVISFVYTVRTKTVGFLFNQWCKLQHKTAQIENAMFVDALCSGVNTRKLSLRSNSSYNSHTLFSNIVVFTRTKAENQLRAIHVLSMQHQQETFLDIKNL